MEEKSKKLTLFDLVAMGVGSVIGSGIFAMTGMGIAQTGSSVNFALILSVIFVTIMLVPSIYLSSVLSLEGGTYTQAAILMNKRNAGIFSIIFFFTNLSISIYVLSIATYLIALVPGLTAYSKLISMAALVLFFLISVKGVKFMAKAQGFMMITMLLAILVFLIVGIPQINMENFTTPESFMTSGAGGFLLATATLSFAAQGGATIVNYSGQAKNPKKDIALSMIISSGIVCLVYFGVGSIAAGVLPISEVAGKDLSLVAYAIMNPVLYYFFIICGAIFALSTSLNNLLGYIKFPILQATKDGWLPQILAKTDEKYDYPYVLMGILFVLGAIPVLTGVSLDILASLVLVPSYLFGIIIMVGTLKIPKMYPNLWAKSVFRVSKPVMVITIALSVIVSLLQAAMMFLSLPWQYMVINIVVFVFIYLYCEYRVKKGYVNMAYIEDLKKDE